MSRPGLGANIVLKLGCIAGAWAELLAVDQLTTERRKGAIFPGFDEARIREKKERGALCPPRFTYLLSFDLGPQISPSPPIPLPLRTLGADQLPAHVQAGRRHRLLRLVRQAPRARVDRPGALPGPSPPASAFKKRCVLQNSFSHAAAPASARAQVLFASPEGLVAPLRYAGLPKPRASDHKPVALALEASKPSHFFWESHRLGQYPSTSPAALKPLSLSPRFCSSPPPSQNRADCHAPAASAPRGRQRARSAPAAGLLRLTSQACVCRLSPSSGDAQLMHVMGCIVHRLTQNWDGKCKTEATSAWRPRGAGSRESPSVLQLATADGWPLRHAEVRVAVAPRRNLLAASKPKAFAVGLRPQGLQRAGAGRPATTAGRALDWGTRTSREKNE